MISRMQQYFSVYRVESKQNERLEKTRYKVGYLDEATRRCDTSGEYYTIFIG